VATIFTSIEPICLGVKINDIGSELLPQLHISLGLLTISYASEVSNLSSTYSFKRSFCIDLKKKDQ
jgi:hypothetical protein